MGGAENGNSLYLDHRIFCKFPKYRTVNVYDALQDGGVNGLDVQISEQQ